MIENFSFAAPALVMLEEKWIIVILQENKTIHKALFQQIHFR